MKQTDIQLDASHKTPSITPLVEIESGLLIKFEMNNPGASHKVRAARHIVRNAIQNGKIIPGESTVIEKTGGNFGIGLALACQETGVPVELAVGLSFSPLKRRYLQSLGATLIGVDYLKQGASPREVVEWHLANAVSLKRKYYFTDQFNNQSSLDAHQLETGPEIVSQLKHWPEVDTITFVGCAGTGAHLTGISRALRHSGYQTYVILVEPDGCNSQAGIFVDHQLEGMAVGVKPPLLDWSLISETIHITQEAMLATQSRFAIQHGYFVGHTSAACIAAAQKVKVYRNNRHKVFTIAYDHGLWYA
jgi:cysteine synthase